MQDVTLYLKMDPVDAGAAGELVVAPHQQVKDSTSFMTQVGQLRVAALEHLEAQRPTKCGIAW